MGARGAPRVCGDDPCGARVVSGDAQVLPAYAGMIPMKPWWSQLEVLCSPRMRG